MAEVAYQHRNDAEIMIASQETEWDWGWDWVEVFTQFGQFTGPHKPGTSHADYPRQL